MRPLRGISKFFNKIYCTIRPGEHMSTIMLALFVGTVSGSANILFRTILEFAKEKIFIEGQHFLHIGENITSRLAMPLLPVFGAILLIVLAKIFSNEVYGYNFHNFLENVNLKSGIINFKTVILKMIAPAITIGSGGSAGVEGPTAQIGGGIGSLTGQSLRFSGKRITLLIAAGSAGAIAATFNAPIAGVMFAMEIILLGNYELMSFGAVVVSAGMATAVSRSYYGADTLFKVPQYEIIGIIETPFYLLLGLFTGILAVIYIKVFYKVKDRFAALPVNQHLKPVIGAFMVGVIGIFFPQVMSDGYEYITDSLSGHYGFLLLLSLVFIKIFATSLTLGSGGAGGVFAPALFIGAMAGGAFGHIANHFFPAYTSQPGAYATVGTGAFLAAATHAPLTGMFLLFEMTGNYKIIIPIMFASIPGVFMAKRLLKDSIDTVELTRKGIDLHAGREMTVLQSIKVRDVMTTKFETINKEASLNDVLYLIITGKGTYFPVTDSNNDMVGILSMHDIQSVLLEERVKSVVTAGALATEDVIVLTTLDTIGTALEKFSIKDIDEIPVVDFKHEKRLAGMLRRGDVIAAYNREMLIRQSEKASV